MAVDARRSKRADLPNRTDRLHGDAGGAGARCEAFPTPAPTDDAAQAGRRCIHAARVTPRARSWEDRWASGRGSACPVRTDRSTLGSRAHAASPDGDSSTRPRSSHQGRVGGNGLLGRRFSTARQDFTMVLSTRCVLDRSSVRPSQIRTRAPRDRPRRRRRSATRRSRSAPRPRSSPCSARSHRRLHRRSPR